MTDRALDSYTVVEIMANLPDIFHQRSLIHKPLMADAYLSSTDIDGNNIYYIGAPDFVLYYCREHELLDSKAEKQWVKKLLNI